MNLKNKKILITGGAGFIGSYLCERLAKEGSKVTVFDNFITGKYENLKLVRDRIKIIKSDIKNKKSIEKASKNQDVIIHQAYPYGVTTRDVEKQFVEEGAVGTFNVLRAALKNNVKKVIYASSVASYGIQKNIPQKENFPPTPFLPYGATKYVGELYCSTFSNVYGLDTVSLRYFNVFGPRYATFDHSALILFLKKALKNEDIIIYGDGSQIRDYTYIDDIVEGTILATKKDKTNGAVYNIAKGKGISILELAQKIVKITGTKSKIRLAGTNEYKTIKKGLPCGITKKIGRRFVDERNYEADISRAKRELGYRPRVTLEEGIRETFQWIKSKV